MADGARVVELMRDRFPEEIIDTDSYRDQHWARIRMDRMLEIFAWLKEDSQASFDLLLDVTAVHWPDDPEPMEIVYHLYSFKRNDRLRVKVRTGNQGPVPTLCGLWDAADWNERETFDMFGIVFEGHPDLRRILMNDEYTDYPLRKELPLYRG